MWTICEDLEVRALALRQCRGVYQRNLIDGVESLSGSTLRGKAASYSGRYRESRDNLLARCRAAGIVVGEERGSKGKRILVLSWPFATRPVSGPLRKGEIRRRMWAGSDNVHVRGGR